MAETATVQIGGPTGRIVSPDLWGLFLEDINYSLDGGLNADLVRNGGFEATPADAVGWGPLTGWETLGAGTVQVRSDVPLSAANSTYVRLNASGGSVTIRNASYDQDGMLVRKDSRYRLRLAARAAGETPKLIARLVGPDGLYGDVVVPVTPDDRTWRWYDLDIEATQSGRCKLELLLESGSVDVDMIELRPINPETDEPLLFREDLVEALAQLRPAFVRFPGGCVAHGYGLDNIYHWKNTIGPYEDRRGMPNTWGYRQSMRIGYHEYFLLCEQIGATPMPVVAAGVCCQNVPGGPQAIPQQRMPQYIQDVLDLIEYANGPADSRWGAVRAAAGHPEPFGLRFLGLGNEDVVDDQFEDRFTQIFEVVQSAHPEVTVIGTLGPKPYGPDYDNGWALARKHGVRMVDEHSYRTPRWLLQNVERFDGYERDGTKVYLGEWAGRTSTVRTAMAEAAYMVGIERNSDVVQLASYAPLLARVGSTQWVPDLIYFTDEQVLPSASYHVAQMFAEHRGDKVLNCSVDGASTRTQPLPSMRTIELSSPGSTTKFRDITINGEPRPDVQVDDESTLLVDGVATAAGAPVELRLIATRVAGEEGLIVGFGDPDIGTVHECRIGEWRNRGLTLSRRDDGIGDEVDGPHPYDGVQTGQDLELRVRIEGARIQVWLDGQQIHDHLDDVRPIPELVVGATARGNDTLVTLVSTADEPRLVRVTGDSLHPGAAGRTVTLAGSGPETGAPFEPSPIEPRACEVTVGQQGLDLEMPPWSLITVTLEGTA